MNYNQINTFFDFLEPVLLKEAGSHHLTNVKVSRWRWDAPEIAITWTKNGIGRNVTTLVEEDQVKIEVNASQNGRYAHRPIATVNLHERETIKTLINLGFDTVLNLTERDFK